LDRDASALFIERQSFDRAKMFDDSRKHTFSL